MSIGKNEEGLVMEDALLTLLVGFRGVLVGAIGQIVVAFLQDRASDRRELRRLGIEAAIAEHGAQMEAAREERQRGRHTIVHPLSSSIYYHVGYMELVAKKRLTRDNLIKLNDQVSELGDVAEELHNRLNPNDATH